MEPSYPKIRTVTLKLITDKPVKKTPYQVKGVFMNQYPDEEIIPLLDGRYRERFLYPRVQVKILNEQIYVVGIHEGVDPILSIAERFDFLDFGNITFQVLDVDVEESDDQFRPISRMIRYRFITPWVALNQATGIRYKYLNNIEKMNYLNRLLSQNIVFLAREMGMELEEKVYTKVGLTSLFPKTVDETFWGAFVGEFRTNFILPNYIGVGNGITRGYGAIFGLYNPAMFSFDEETLQQEISGETPEEEPDDMPDDMPEVMPETGGIGMEDVPPPRERKKPQGPGRRRSAPPPRSRKVLSEEFEIDDEPLPPEHKSANRKETGKGKGDEFTEDESKFNREEYHRKHHEL